MWVVIEGNKIRLNQADLLGEGGEGMVFKTSLKSRNVAVKIYHQPTAERAEKLEAFLSHSWLIPTNKVSVPNHLVCNANGEVIGLTMPLFSRGFEELASLSNKRYRAATLTTSKEVGEIFIDGWETIKKVHDAGLVIGDLNDLNSLFRGKEMLFIDVDAWQFGKFPCSVAMEQFLAPELYGIQLGTRPVFKVEHDWYAFAVMLFKSLLMVHPYGGTHPGIKLLTQRAAQKVTVFNRAVTYPKIALTPDILDDDLAHAFERFFAKGKREIFPLEVLRSYVSSLIECKGCGAFYPKTKKICPICSAKTIVIVPSFQTSTKGIKVTEFLRTNGRVVFHKVIGVTLYVLCYEQGKAVLYLKKDGVEPVRKELFSEIPGARFEMVGEILVVNLPNQTELLLVDTTTLTAFGKTETRFYTPNRKAIFRSSGRKLFRIAGDYLMYGEVVNGRLIERPLRQVMAEQTWFGVKQDDGESQKPTVCGFFRVFGKQLFWLVWEGRSYDNLAVSQLEVGETLIDLSVKFSSNSVLIRRLTQYGGVGYLRTDVVDDHGKVVQSLEKISENDHPAFYLHGQVYKNGRLLSATDEGIIQEDLEQGSIKTFEATRGQVEGGNSLEIFENGLLVIAETSVTQLVLS